MNKKILLILADGFEELEALGALDFWRRTGFTVTLAGLSGRDVTGAHELTVKADALLAEVKDEHFDAIALPGGMPGAKHLFDSETVGDLVTHYAADGRVVAAICAAPIVLAKAALLRDGGFTIFPSPELAEQYLHGLKPTGKPAETAGTIVTGRGPGAVFAWAQQVAEALGAGAEARQVAVRMLLPEGWL